MAHYGIGPLTAVVILAELGDARRFSSAREASEETLALAEQIAQGEAAARLRAQVAQRHPEARLDQVEDAFQEACLLAVRRARAPSDGLLPAGGPVPLKEATRQQPAAAQAAPQDCSGDCSEAVFGLTEIGPAGGTARAVARGVLGTV